MKKFLLNSGVYVSAALFAGILYAPAPALGSATSQRVPLESSPQWIPVHFPNIPKSHVVFEEKKLVLRVQKSAGAMVYRFQSPMNISGIRLRGSLSQIPNLRDTDDRVLRVGLLEPGSEKFSTLERMLAPSWVRALTRHFGEISGGIGAFRFFSVTTATATSTAKTRPESKIAFFEEISARLAQPGDFSLSIAIPKPIRSLGIWLGADGDDSKAQFETQIISVELETKASP